LKEGFPCSARVAEALISPMRMLDKWLATSSEPEDTRADDRSSTEGRFLSPAIGYRKNAPTLARLRMAFCAYLNFDASAPDLLSQHANLWRNNPHGMGSIACWGIGDFGTRMKLSRRLRKQPETSFLSTALLISVNPS
jgi:hypothetical protein